MWKIISPIHKLTCGVSAFSSLYVFIFSWWKGDREMILSQYFSPLIIQAISIFVFLFAIGLFVILNLAWINALRPSTRLHALTDEIRDLLELIASDYESNYSHNPVTSSEARALADKLKPLGIESPSLNLFTSGDRWLRWLPHLRSAAERRKIHEARRLIREGRVYHD